MSGMDTRNKPSPVSRKPGLSLWRTVKAVAWSFVGLRQRGEFEEDVKRISPVHILVVGLVGAMLFVGGLILLVSWVTAA